MNEDLLAAGLDDNHPLLWGLERFLKRCKLNRSSIQFVADRILFAYPRTLWFQFTADAPSEVRSRHALDPLGIGRAINRWLIKSGDFRAVVFDLRGVTILDIEDTIDLFRATQSGLAAAYYLCHPDLAHVLNETGVIMDQAIFEELDDLLDHLSDPKDLKLATIALPEHLDMTSLDLALSQQAPRSKITGHDVVVFQMSNVITADFQAISMIPAMIHTLAQRYGTLTWVTNPRRKLARLLERYGALRAVHPYLVQGSAAVGGSDQNWPGLAMRSFTKDNLHELDQICESKFDEMLDIYRQWFMAQAGLWKGSMQTAINFRARILFELRHLIWELAENAAHHSHGVGYLMIELDPSKGLQIYVGDTGIGLARSIPRAYYMKRLTDAGAASIVLHLREPRYRRRRLPGTHASGGRGLERVRLILHDIAGYFCVRTGNAQAIYMPGKSRDPQELDEKLFDVEGTHLHILIPTR